MYAEVLGGLGLFAFLLIFIAEVSNKKPIGVIASLLIILLGIWLLGDTTLLLKMGETATLTQNNLLNNSLNTSLHGVSATGITNVTEYNETLTGLLAGDTNISYTRVATNNYISITTPYFNLSQVLGLILISLGFYGTVAYGVDVFTTVSQG